MPREHLFEAHLTWTGGQSGPTRTYEGYSREYEVEMPGKPAFSGSAAVPYRGDGSLPNPEDLLLASVSACHMLSFLAECAFAKVEVSRYEDSCTARMMIQDGKMRIVEAILRPRVEFVTPVEEKQIELLHTKAHDVCFIANSVNFPIRHELS